MDSSRIRRLRGREVTRLAIVKHLMSRMLASRGLPGGRCCSGFCEGMTVRDNGLLAMRRISLGMLMLHTKTWIAFMLDPFSEGYKSMLTWNLVEVELELQDGCDEFFIAIFRYDSCHTRCPTMHTKSSTSSIGVNTNPHPETAGLGNLRLPTKVRR